MILGKNASQSALNDSGRVLFEKFFTRMVATIS